MSRTYRLRQARERAVEIRRIAREFKAFNQSTPIPFGSPAALPALYRASEVQS